MVFESLISPSKAKGKPFEMLILGFFYAGLAIFFTYWLFWEQASLIMVFLTVIAALPLFFHTLKTEEKQDIISKNEKAAMKEHFKAIKFLTYMFFGFVIAFTILFVVLSPPTSQKVFSSQLKTIEGINSKVSGNAYLNSAYAEGADASVENADITFDSKGIAEGKAGITDNGAGITGGFSAWGFFSQILVNNLNVLFFCIVFSLIYGAGAIFILTWNASVISAAIGTFIRNNISSYAESIGLVKIAGYFHVASFGLLKYAIHGIPEVAGYFVGALAGGIVSVAIIRHEFGSKSFTKIISDALLLFVFAVIILIIAALIEVFITPSLF